MTIIYINIALAMLGMAFAASGLMFLGKMKSLVLSGIGCTLSVISLISAILKWQGII